MRLVETGCGAGMRVGSNLLQQRVRRLSSFRVVVPVRRVHNAPRLQVWPPVVAC